MWFGICFYSSDRVLALSDNSGFDAHLYRGFLKTVKPSMKEITSHSFNLENMIEPRSFGLNAFHSGKVSFSEGVERIVNDQLLNTPIKMIPKQSLNLTNSGNIESISYTFSVDGTNICNTYLSAFRFQDDSSYIVGQIPETNPFASVVDSNSWPGLAKSFSTVINELEVANFASSTLPLETLMKKTVSHESKCFYPKNGDLIPVWDFIMSVNNLPYHVISGEYEVFLFEPYFFENVEGKARVYKKNPVDGEKVDVLLDLIDPTEHGFLDSDHFTTSPVDVDRATSTDHNFVYEKEDKEFAEVSVFAHATSHLAWFFKNGYEWSDFGPMELIIHGNIQGDINNSQYKPGIAMTNNLPMIQICDGDGVILKDLPYDTDVVSHELGHHIVFSKVKTTIGESLVLHEGLSDYFVFARTGDNCLADSICPTGAQACITDTCLRVGVEPDILSYGDSAFSKLGAHHKGQAISGLLWRLRESGSIPAEDLDKTVVKSTIEFLQSNSGYRHLFLGLLNADKALSNGKYACPIVEAAKDYGFSSFVSDINCETVSSTNIPKPSDEPNSTTTGQSSSSSSSKKSPLGCAVQNHTIENQSIGTNVINVMLFLCAATLPLLIVRKPKTARIRITSSKKPFETHH